MAFAGVTTWDGARFAEVWGKEWVETRDVTDRQIIADEPLDQGVPPLPPPGHRQGGHREGRHRPHGRAGTLVRLRPRHSVPPGHAVLSVTSVRGEHAPPVLVDLRS